MENEIDLCRIRDLQMSLTQFETLFHKRFGLSLNEGMILCTLSCGAPQSCGLIGAGLGLSQSNTSKLLGHLENKGFLRRALSQKDRRQILFSLTEAGKEMLASIRQHPCEIPEPLKLILQSSDRT